MKDKTRNIISACIVAVCLVAVLFCGYKVYVLNAYYAEIMGESLFTPVEPVRTVILLAPDGKVVREIEAKESQIDTWDWSDGVTIHSIGLEWNGSYQIK